MASGFKLPKKNILISIGDTKFKYEFINSAKILRNLGFNLYGTEGTYCFYKQENIQIKCLNILEILPKIERGEIDMVVNIPAIFIAVTMIQLAFLSDVKVLIVVCR